MSSSERLTRRSDQSFLVNDASLRTLGARDPLGMYLQKLWQRRHFISLEARARAFQGHRGMWLGKAWIVLNPLVEAATYGLIFGLLLNTSRGIDNFIGYLLIGIIFFGFLRQGLNGGAGLIRSNRTMIAAFRFPRASLVFGLCYRQFLDNTVPAAMAVLVALAGQLDKQPTTSLLAVIPAFILIHIFCVGLTFWVAWITAFVPDFKAVLQVVGRAWFYVSGVFFSIENFATHPLVAAVMEANPGYQFLVLLRTAVLDTSWPHLDLWVSTSVWSLSLLVTGFLVFWSAEARYVKTI